MNVYVTSRHRAPTLCGTTQADHTTARSAGFEVDLFLHPGGAKEWAICLRADDNPARLPGWRPVLLSLQC
jgi:hypothetical protein